MPDPANSYNLRSWRLYKLSPETPISAREVKLLIDDIIATIEGYNRSVGGILVPDTKGQLLTHNGTAPSLLNIGTNGRIPVSDSTLTNGFDWKDPSVLGFMTALLVRENGTDIGSRTAINFIDGGGITWTITDDAGNGEVEITAAVTFPTTTVRVPVPLNAANLTGLQNTTYYFGGIPSFVPQTAITRVQVPIPVAGTITEVHLRATWGNTPSGNDHLLYVRLNNTTDTLFATTPISTAASVPLQINATGLSIAVTTTDTIAIKWITPATWTTPATNLFWNGFVVIEY